MSKLKKYKNKRKSDKTRKLFKIRSINKDNVELLNGSKKRLIIFNSRNITTESEKVQQENVSSINKAIITFSEPLSIRSLNISENLSVQKDYWEKKLNDTSNIFNRKFIEHQLYNISTVHDNPKVKNKIFIFTYTIKDNAKFNSKERDFLQKLGLAGECRVAEKEELVKLIYQDFKVKSCGVEKLNEKDFFDLEQLEELDNSKSNLITASFLKNALPQSYNFARDHVVQDDMYLAIYGLVASKQYINFGDFYEIANHLDIDINIQISTKSISAFALTEEADKLNYQIGKALKENKQESEIQVLRTVKSRINAAKKSVEQNGDRLLKSQVFIRMSTNNFEYNKVFLDLKNEVLLKGYNIEICNFTQKEAYLSSSVLNIPTKVFKGSGFELDMSCASLINMYPFSSQLKSVSNSSIPFSWNVNSCIMLDPLKDAHALGSNNNNMVIFGQSGIGKSTLIKKIAIPEIIKGIKMFIIDPESEFSQLTIEQGGKIIRPQSHIINPLQPKVTEYINDSDELVKVRITDHISNVIIFMKFLNSDFNQHVISKALREMYAMHGITDNTDLSNLGNDRYPVFDDLFKVLFRYLYSEANLVRYMQDSSISWLSFHREANATEQMQYEFEKQIAFVETFTSRGTYGSYFNGHTTLKLDENEKLYVFDINTLIAKKDDGLTSAMYFSILTFIEHHATADKTEKTIVFADEAHLMLKNSMNFVVDYLESFAKRLRKNESCLWLATQDLLDFTAAAVKDKATKILANSPIKIMMYLEETQLIELKKFYKLTPREEKIIKTSQKGQGLLVVGTKKFKMDVIYNKQELNLLSYNPEKQEYKKLVARAKKIGIDYTHVDLIETYSARNLKLKEMLNLDKSTDSVLRENYLLKKEIKELRERHAK